MKEMTAQQLEEALMKTDRIELIDVREEFEVKLGKIPSAKNIPLQQLLDSLDELDKSKEYILICRSGQRSGMAGQLLEMQGFKTVNIIDGMIGWQGEKEFDL
ncbi:MAG TPA: rhodanese-like domain-containing protein [Pseudogracilibacillus sp.]|nr:rhodanese-like domain-containing protein [Pseudogracilibacillus sp.]